MRFRLSDCEFYSYNFGITLGRKDY